MSDPKLVLKDITKSFPGVIALNNVSLNLYAGEVTALIGENGAGKSTLVKVLTGIHLPNSGDIIIDGEPVKISSAHDAFECGISAIHQETVLFDELSVAENIYLGHAPKTRFGTINWREMRTKARQVLDDIGAKHIGENTKLSELGIANKHLVAVARAMSIDAQIVIMDEPTAALSHREIEDLFTLIELLKSEGKAILFISHKFDEIYRIADRFAVYRDGEMVGDGSLPETPQSEIIQMMVGRAVNQIYPTRTSQVGDTLLKIDNLNHPTEFADISFELKKGEILGFYGLVGAGRSEVMQALFGITKTSSGTITLDGQIISPKSPADAIQAGIVYVPEERGTQGVVTDMPIFQNVSLPSLRKTSRGNFLKIAEEFALAREYTTRLDLRASSLSQHAGTLSGGNQQKILIAKWLATNPDVIILDEPTKGIDIGSKAAVHEFMAELVEQGLSVIMVSSELPEIMGMSDRIVVMNEGRIIKIVENDDELTPAKMLVIASGITEDAA